MSKYVFRFVRLPVLANDNDAFIPELWANETLAIMYEQMVVGNLVHRGFENQIQQFGDVVNTRKPVEFTAYRKNDTDAVTVQDAQSPNIRIPLDQWFHTTFIIYDGEASKSFKQLAETYAGPAAKALMRAADRVILGQYSQLINLGYVAGKLGGLSSTTAHNYMIETREVLNRNKAVTEGRNQILSTGSESEILKTDIFITADKVGDNGTAMREASIGRKFGVNYWLSQNMAEVVLSQTDHTDGLINMASGAAKGALTVTVDGFSAAIAAGRWVTIAGVPYRVVSITGGATPTAIVPHIGLVADIVDNDPVSWYGGGLVNKAAGYASGYSKDIAVDTITSGKTPQIGQIVTFFANATAVVYTIIALGTTTATTAVIYLDRPLEAALVDNDIVNFGPAGNFNMLITQGAIAFVNRPLQAAPAGAGALSVTRNNEWLAIRVTIAYNSTLQGTQITMDMLCGIKMIEPLCGAVMLG